MVSPVSSAEGLLDSFLEDCDFCDDGFDDDCDGEHWVELGSDSSDSAFRWTEETLSRARETSRQLVAKNGYAINGIENRISYVVGGGYDIRLESKVDFVCPEDDLRDARAFIEEFLDRSEWRRRQIEILRRYDRDGEAIIRFFVDKGLTSVRFVEPDSLYSPTDVDFDAPFGILFSNDDIELPLFYFVDGEDPIDASDIDHRKANVDISAPRGVPLYYPVFQNLKRAESLLKNMSILSKIQSAIALIRKHRQSSGTNIEQFVKDSADQTRPSPGLSSGQVYKKQYAPGTILDVSDQIDYEFPSAAVNASRFVSVLQAELRSIASRLVMPEFMLTSDASNSAYASTMVAEGPAVRMFTRIQSDMVSRDKMLMERVLFNGVSAGLLSETILSCVDVLITPPTVRVKELKEEAEVDQIAFNAGILSRQTWSRKLGLDYEREQRNIQKERNSDVGTATDD